MQKKNSIFEFMDKYGEFNKFSVTTRNKIIRVLDSDVILDFELKYGLYRDEYPSDYNDELIQILEESKIIEEFMEKYGLFSQFPLEFKNKIVKIIGDSVTIEYVPSTGSVQFVTHNLDRNKDS